MLVGLADDLAGLGTTPNPYAPRRARTGHPDGWEPGVTFDSARGQGTVTGVSETPDPDWSVLLRAWGFDPERFFVDPDLGVQVRTWEAAVGGGEVRQLWYHRATIRAGRARDRADLEQLLAEVRRHRPRARPQVDTDITLVVALADWQTGKGEGGGSDALVGRVLALADALPRHVRRLARIGRRPSRLVMLGMGDLVEGCGDDWYAMGSFQQDLDRRSQVTLVRRLLLKLLEQWVPLVPEVLVACVPGNHGENRRAGKAFTTFGDNDDVAVFEQVADVCAQSAALDHVRFVIPRDELTVTLDVHGKILGAAHGHQLRRGAGPQGKARAWLADQALGQTPIGDADILITGHYHHLQVVDFGPRLWLQCPALDGGSRWFTDTAGARATVGTLTFTVDQGGWGDLTIV